MQTQDAQRIAHSLQTTNPIPSDQNRIFAPILLHEPQDVRVVMVGRSWSKITDQAVSGFLFELKQGYRPNVAIKNIHKELSREYNIDPHQGVSMSRWREQGVMLLTTSPTLGQAKLWESYIHSVLEIINQQNQGVVFVFFDEKNFVKSVDSNRHSVIQCKYPSCRQFVGSGVFNNINKELIKNNRKIINWDLKNVDTRGKAINQKIIGRISEKARQD